MYFLIVLDLPTPSLNCTLSQDRRTCPNRNLTFTCEAIDSDLIAWKSDEYIGQGGRELQLSYYNVIGTEVRNEDNPNTVATLVNRYIRHGLPVLVCQLNITVSPNILNSSHSVTCLNADLQTTAHFQFSSQGNYS